MFLGPKVGTIFEEPFRGGPQLQESATKKGTVGLELYSLQMSRQMDTAQDPDPCADPKSRSTLGFHNVLESRIGGIYFLDPPDGPGIQMRL